MKWPLTAIVVATTNANKENRFIYDIKQCNSASITVLTPHANNIVYR